MQSPRILRNALKIFVLTVTMFFTGVLSVDAAVFVDIGKDFDNSVTPQEGYSPYTDSNDDNFKSFDSPIGASDSDGDSNADVEVKVRTPYYRSADSGDTMTLELKDIKAVTYFITTYHHQNYSKGFDEDLGRDMDVYLTDANRTDKLLYDQQVVTAGDDLSSVPPTTLVTKFSVSGPSQTTELTFESLATSGGSSSGVNKTEEMSTLNGFEVVVPEPATFALLSIVFATLLMRRRKR